MRSIRRRALPAITVGLALLLIACVPSDRRGLREVDDSKDSGTRESEAPIFPDDGEVAPELVVDGLAHDFTERPRDQSYWSPLSEEARCAAEQIVTSVGSDRLVGLGYRPGVAGASLNDVELTDVERQQVIDAFGACVDMVEGIASLLYADGRMPPTMATCVARGLGKAGATDVFIEAWASGGAVDPFAEGSDFAVALLGNAEVCLPEAAFNWPDVSLPADDPVIDSDLPAGTSRSPFADDATTTTTTSPASPGTPTTAAP